MLRVVIYKYDMGIFRRAYIQTVTRKEFAELKTSSYITAMLLDSEDFYGQCTPQIINHILPRKCITS